MKVSYLIKPILNKDIYNFDILDEVNVLDITTDSRLVKEGSLFACVPGHNVDGHNFAKEAIDKGAVAILAEKYIDLQVPQIIVPKIIEILPIIADRFYGQPTKRLQLIGITGTNGKTTTTYLVEKICKDYGKKVGVIGTIEMRIGDKTYPVNNTTPESVILQKDFNIMVEEGVDVAVIEVSSHALELGRVAGCDFNIAAFTNLTQDHLDFHVDMESYKQAKAKLFSRLGNTYEQDKTQKFAVLNADDCNYNYFAAATVAQTLSFGIDSDADIKANDVLVASEGVSFNLISRFGNANIDMKLTGKFSVYNALAAISICLLQGIPLLSIKQSLEDIEGVPGRFEKVYCGQDYSVIVDYAHTADSLENVLETIKEFTKNRIITVFGCGGDRDRTKRPLMGKVARDYSDISIITSDNPRTEDLVSIIDDIMIAYEDAPIESYIRIDDRATAIQHAIKIAKAGDAILIAGKGHETYQIIGREKYDFDDRLVAMEAIKNYMEM
jgi:UDP-N-acetylmuramoyl-L-alanyl-D-glutamate--2,6-diaminopimelate ligase